MIPSTIVERYPIFNYAGVALLERSPTNVPTCALHNKRYLGSKYRLLSFIKNIVARECVGVQSFADLFAGTGAVSSAFSDKTLIINDILYSNYICHIAWFGSEIYETEKIKTLLTAYNDLYVTEDNYMSEHFADTFFSTAVCRKIGFIRNDIEHLFVSGRINTRERALLITSLLYAMDKIANTCGHYDAYRKSVLPQHNLRLCLPRPLASIRKNYIYNMDANDLARTVQADVVYLDPPYNSRQYCDAYHLLENVAEWKQEAVYGVAKKINRAHLKSAYCTRQASSAFHDLITHIRARYILLSYNNMHTKGNDRSNARMSDEMIMDILTQKGEVKIFTQKHKAFTTGKSDRADNEERLFLCVCK